MSRISAPCLAISAAWAMALAGSRNWPPSEKESGVTLRMPITNGRPSEYSAESAFAADFGAVPGAFSRVRTLPMPVALRGRRGAVKQPRRLIGDLERQKLGVLDPAFDDFLRRQQADQSALLVGVGHRLGKIGRVSIL